MLHKMERLARKTARALRRAFRRTLERTFSAHMISKAGVRERSDLPNAARSGDASTATEGLPPGLSFEIIEELCSRYKGRTLEKIEYWPLSDWKSTCSTYRLALQLSAGQQWNVIYKDARYPRRETGERNLTNGEIAGREIATRPSPALAGLPVKPGPAEYQVYAGAVSGASQNSSPLSPYLPEVYAALEIVPGEHYQYVLEDLAPLYEKNSQPEWLLRAAAALPALHEAMALWQAQVWAQERQPGRGTTGRSIAEGVQPVGAAPIRYDAAYTAGLAAYAARVLPAYCARVPSPVASVFLSHWPAIHALLTAPQPARHLAELQGDTSPGGLRPVHGDFNITNLLFHQQDPSRIKIIDWEWSGLGSPYIDLACLLHPVRPELETAALAEYHSKRSDHMRSNRLNEGLGSDSDPKRSGGAEGDGAEGGDHRSVYLWAKLQRGLLNASFTALQIVEGDGGDEGRERREWKNGSPQADAFRPAKFIELSLQRVVQAFQEIDVRD